MNYKNSCDGDGTRKFTICFSGKRKSGKDYVALKLTKLLQEEGCTVSICHLSDPLKERFAAMKTEMGYDMGGITLVFFITLSHRCRYLAMQITKSIGVVRIEVPLEIVS